MAQDRRTANLDALKDMLQKVMNTPWLVAAIVEVPVLTTHERTDLQGDIAYDRDVALWREVVLMKEAPQRGAFTMATFAVTKHGAP